MDESSAPTHPLATPLFNDHPAQWYMEALLGLQAPQHSKAECVWGWEQGEAAWLIFTAEALWPDPVLTQISGPRAC